MVDLDCKSGGCYVLRHIYTCYITHFYERFVDDILWAHDSTYFSLPISKDVDTHF